MIKKYINKIFEEDYIRKNYVLRNININNKKIE